MSYEEERAQLEQITPKSLPGNAAESGLSADLIQEKFYAGIFYLHDLLNEARVKFAADDAVLEADIVSLDNALTALAARVTTLEEDTLNYARLMAQVEALQTLTASHTTSISTIQSAIATINANIATLRSDIINGTISAYKAIRDGDGNVIKTTYATKLELTATNNEITKIKNGDTIVGKAVKDQNGDIINSTYIKIAAIIDALTSTSTTAPLSANQGKVLNEKINAILALLASNDTDLDTVQEIVTYIKNNKSLIDGVTTNKVNISDIIDNLTSALANKPLSANQGVVLKALIDALDSSKSDKSNTYTKDEAQAMADAKIAGITGVNVITDQDDEKVYDWRIVVRGERVYLSVTDITETE